jgi:hypothetical protein
MLAFRHARIDAPVVESTKAPAFKQARAFKSPSPPSDGVRSTMQRLASVESENCVEALSPRQGAVRAEIQDGDDTAAVAAAVLDVRLVLAEYVGRVDATLR